MVKDDISVRLGDYILPSFYILNLSQHWTLLFGNQIEIALID